MIKLEQNYRSTQNILNAANAVISNNVGRKAKTLWTDNDEGDKIRFRQFDTAYDEAEFIVDDIREQVDRGNGTYNDNAILYRTNAQSRIFEEKFVTANIPYKIVGGINFYARREIKDLLCYLKTIDNGKDDLAVRRVINVPKRGIGLTSINRVQDYAAAYSAMKPKQAAAIFEQMTNNLDLAARILKVMSAEDRGKILGAMNSEVAAKITKIMDPES